MRREGLSKSWWKMAGKQKVLICCEAAAGIPPSVTVASPA